MNPILRIGVSQIPNSTDVRANLSAILESLDAQRELGADLVLFPECAMSGFSAEVRETDFSEILGAIETVQMKARELGLSVVIPSALRAGDGRFVNSGFVFLSDGKAHQFFKDGLTDSERRFFAAGRAGTRVFDAGGFKVGLLVCAEAALAPWRYFEPKDCPDVLLWPGYWGWDADLAWVEDRLKGLAPAVHRNVSHWRRPLIQSNFSSNAADDARAGGPTGMSVVIDPSNQLVMTGYASRRDDFVVEIEKSVAGVTIRGFRRA